MTKKLPSIPDAEWTISIQLDVVDDKAIENKQVLFQGAIGIVDTQRNNIGYLTQQHINEAYEKIKKPRRKRVKDKGYHA